jgi:DNA-binding FadR family transcriptional regulator
VTEQLREKIFGVEEDSRIGSLPELAESLGVGIVTVQQAARVLEHEGLLHVRRGPGGGYYGRRPDVTVLERTLAAFMRTYPATWEEALDLTSLLFNEVCAAAAACQDAGLRTELTSISKSVSLCEGIPEMGELEGKLQELLFRMVKRPLFALLTQVTLHFSAQQHGQYIYTGVMNLQKWRSGRQRIIAAILEGDPELARFEAMRNNRRVIMSWLASSQPSRKSPR